MPWLRPDPDRAVGALDGGKRHRQAESRAFADALRGEEGLEDPRAGRLVHPHPGVADGDGDMGDGDVATEIVLAAHRIRRVEFRRADLDGQATAVRHGIDTIDDEIDQRLLEFGSIEGHEGHRIQPGHDLDRLGDEALQERQDVANELRDVDRIRPSPPPGARMWSSALSIRWPGASTRRPRRRVRHSPVDPPGHRVPRTRRSRRSPSARC